uniref:Uncharacterized protein n=1 Tax=Kalanchoe fedtschenkoi TaxID=63787 RepID=A0A7N0TKL4_KALFE
MGEALFDLEQVLRSKRVTPQETNVLLTCKSEAIKDFVIGASVGAGLTWFATRRAKTFLRINLLAGGAFIAGMWRFSNSLDASVDQILSMDGSRMQTELANIIVHKYRDNPWGMQRISKHFYIEEVYEDTHPDRPKLRWRPRNAFTEKVDCSETTKENHQNGSLSNSDGKLINLESSSRQVSALKDAKQIDLHGDRRQVYAAKVDPGLKTIDDPLDFVFGYSSEEDQLSKTPSNRAAVKSRGHRRAHRRRRMHRQQEGSSSNSGYARMQLASQ